jgi:hypothetical protein
MSPEELHPDDRALEAAFAVLEPSPERVRRVEGAVLKALDERPASLVSEWWGLLTARPVVNTGYLLAATAVLLVTTPLGSLAALLVRGLG